MRELLGKGAQFAWNKQRERSFQLLLSMMNDKMYLAPYNPDYKTHQVTDASPWGISASIYQEDKQNRWIPVDHITRALSQCREFFIRAQFCKNTGEIRALLRAKYERNL